MKDTDGSHHPLFLNAADKKNAALRRLNALEKSLGQAEKNAADAAEALEREQKEAEDRE